MPPSSPLPALVWSPSARRCGATVARLASGRGLVPLVPLLAACSGQGLAVEVPWLEVPDAVTWTDARVGRTNEALVELRNIGTGAGVLELRAEPPFTAPDSAVALEPGATHELPLWLVPMDYAPADGVLELVVGRDRWTVALHGTVDDDADGDGFVALEAGGDDCDDDDPAAYPGAPEACDGVDTDCDGEVHDVEEPPLWYPDDDGDGFGDTEVAVAACEPPDGWVARDGDCDDADPGVHADAEEVRDGADQDCDGWIDEGLFARGTLLMTEIMVEPALPPERGRYLELLNPTDGHVDLGQVALDLGDGPVLLPPRWLAPGELVLLCADDDPTRNGGLPCDLSVDGAWAWAIVSASGLVLDEVDWTSWSLPAGAALELGAGGLDADANDDEAAWCRSEAPLSGAGFGTPGLLDPPC